MKAVIFDLDGTLLDTIDDIACSMNEVLKRHSLPQHTIDGYKIFVGKGVASLIRQAAAGAEAAGLSLSGLETEYRAEYSKRQADRTAPYAGIPELLSALASRSVKLAVLSNKPHEATLEVIAHFFPDVLFSAVIGQRQGRPAKPDPNGAFEILKLLVLTSEDVLFVGDSGTDMQTAKAAGLKAAGALWGFRGKKELVENGADVLAERPLDLLELV
ncbi:MAG: HAD family hydrolase [Clostridiales bacterium]|nr:HAD family hydrolase [Clostridiales bacterium]